jgi:rod shape-determining protein MreD
MNTNVVYNALRFIILLAVQILILNQIRFGGFVTPFLYVLFILLYPINSNKYGFLLASFSIGLLMDLFMDTGVHAVACLLLSYFRPYFLRFSFGLSYEFQTIKIAEKLSVDRFTFMAFTIVFHHFIIFSLEIIRLDLFFDILFRTLFSSIFTFILCVITIYLIKSNKR